MTKTLEQHAAFRIFALFAIACAIVFFLPYRALAQDANTAPEPEVVTAASAADESSTEEAAADAAPAEGTEALEGTDDTGGDDATEEDEGPSPADIIAQVRPKLEGKVLRYGADLEGGVPYVFVDPMNEDKLLGFEVEIMEALAKRLGMTVQHVQNDWDKLIPGLQRDLYDIAIQGQEITPEHEEAVAFTIPYYVTYLQLAVQKNMFLINSLEDCHNRVVGTLKESQAFYILESLGDVDIRAYATEVNGYDDLVNGRLDATLFDAPVALYYGGPRPEVKFVGPEIGRIVYGFALAKKNEDLLNGVNAGLQDMRDTGELRKILERWNLWSAAVANEFNDFGPSKTEPTVYNEWVAQQRPYSPLQERMHRYWSFLPILGRAAVTTMEISVCSMLMAIFVGFILAVLRVYAPGPLSLLATLYIEIVRGTPVLIQLFFIFYGLPAIGIKFSPFAAGVVGLGLNYAAYEAENYRAGLMSVPRTQMEAALTLAMTRWQAIRHVIAPQAIRVSLPPVTNDFISLIKDSSLVSVITMVELTKVYGQLAVSYYDYFGTGILVAIIYLLLGLPFVRLARWTEKRLTFDRQVVPGRAH